MGEVEEVVVDLTSGDHSFTLAGPPISLARARYSWKTGFYNPSKAKSEAVKREIVRQIPHCRNDFLYGDGVAVTMSLTFYLRRPDSDFTCGKRWRGLKSSCVGFKAPIRPDIDNLVKFILDACNHLVYKDNGQVVKLTSLKIRDCEGECTGRTVVKMGVFH